MAFSLNRTESPLSREERYKINENWAKIESGYNGIVDVVSTQAFEKVVDAAKIDWLAPVDTFTDLTTTYPNAIEGNAAMAKDTGIIYRFDGSQWKPIQQIDATAINEVDSRLSAEIDEINLEINRYNPDLVQYIYVDSTNGSDSNDGTINSPFKTLYKAIDSLRRTGEALINKPIEIKLTGSFTNGTNIHSLPRFRYPLRIVGEINTDGTPNTVFDGLNATVKRGLNIEPAMDLVVEIENIYFKNFTDSSGTGIGIQGKRGGNIKVYNCIAENCDIGFMFTNNTNFTVTKSKAINCKATGFRAMYSSSGTFGNGSGGSLEYACEANGCPQGFYISRNASVHIDYCKALNSSYAGILIDINSRAHVLGTLIEGNNYGVRCEGGAEWINNTTEPNTFSDNTVHYGHFGNSRETRLYSQTAQNEFRIGSDMSTKTLTGSTAQTVLYFGSNLGIVPTNFFGDSTKKLRLRVFGKAEGVGTKSLSFYVEDPVGGALTSLGTNTLNSNGAFIYEVEIIPTSLTSQKVLHNLEGHGGEIDVVPSTRTIDFTTEKQFRFYATLSDAATVLTLEGMEVYLMG